jgi:hypothetical protein
MAGEVLANLMGQLDWHWENHLRPRWEGLTDDEYFWEPAPGCWTVRQVDGRFVPDGRPLSVPSLQSETPPFTTIAWRVCHIAADCLSIRTNLLFGDGSLTTETFDYPGTARDGLAALEQGYASWRAGVESLGEEGIWRKLGPKMGPYADDPWIGLILHQHREVIHHGAEVCLLRDLYRARGGAPTRSLP